MKNKIMIASVALLIVGVSTLSFAETFEKRMGVTYTMIAGQIQSVDEAKNFIIVKDASTGLEKTVYVYPMLTASLKTGDNVKVTLGQGSNLALGVSK